MSQGARVTSIEAIREFRAALLEFAHESHNALAGVDLETRRALDWLLERQPGYWQNEVKSGHDRVLQAKNDLHRCRGSPLPGGGVPSCMEERKALERAQRRLAYAEEKVIKVRSWGRTTQQEVNEYSGRANQLSALLDGDIPRAVEFLSRTLASLESYLAVGMPAAGAVTDMARSGEAVKEEGESDKVSG